MWTIDPIAGMLSIPENSPSESGDQTAKSGLSDMTTGSIISAGLDECAPNCQGMDGRGLPILCQHSLSPPTTSQTPDSQPAARQALETELEQTLKFAAKYPNAKYWSQQVEELQQKLETLSADSETADSPVSCYPTDADASEAKYWYRHSPSQTANTGTVPANESTDSNPGAKKLCEGCGDEAVWQVPQGQYLVSSGWIEITKDRYICDQDWDDCDIDGYIDDSDYLEKLSDYWVEL